MCFTAKSSVSNWWILAFIALFLWYRNERYDRALAIFVLILGLAQLIEYGLRSGADPSQSGHALYVTLWLQTLVLSICVFVFINDCVDKNGSSVTQSVVHTIAGWNLFLFSIVFVVALVLSYTTGSTFSGSVGTNGIVDWTMDGGPILGNFGWLYVVGIFVPLLLIFAFYSFADIEIAILILYGILTAAYVLSNYSTTNIISAWGCIFSIGFATLAYFLGNVISATNHCT